MQKAVLSHGRQLEAPTLAIDSGTNTIRIASGVGQVLKCGFGTEKSSSIRIHQRNVVSLRSLGTSTRVCPTVFGFEDENAIALIYTTMDRRGERRPYLHPDV